MAETSELEFELTRRRAEREGYFVERHRHYDPAQSPGDLYIQHIRKFRGEKMQSLLSYATSDEIHRYLNDNPLTQKEISNANLRG